MMSVKEKKRLYLECYSGISGDMMAAALLDLGADQGTLQKVLRSLPINGFETKISRVKRAGLDVCDFDVVLEQDNHDHDMDYLHGNKEKDHHPHHHEHRTLDDILEIIRKSEMSERARETAENIFMILARAEAKAHGIPETEVHFHEVGAVDSIVDIVTVATCLDSLNVQDVIVSPLYEGFGSIRCQHGILPIPVPAVANIIRDKKLVLHMTDTEGELVTPTGAAIAAAIGSQKPLPKRYIISNIGVGAGKRTYDRPSLLRAMIIEDLDEEKDEVIKLESNIDDCTGEALGYTMERLFAAGARDVHYMPVYMKKNRPGYQLNVICDDRTVKILQEIIFEETTTIGIRVQRMERCLLKREKTTKQTSLGPVEIKICKLPSGTRIYPEFESIAKICREKGISYQETWRQILKEYDEAE